MIPVIPSDVPCRWCGSAMQLVGEYAVGKYFLMCYICDELTEVKR
jgi:hypothetical protein